MIYFFKRIQSTYDIVLNICICGGGGDVYIDNFRILY